MKKIICTLLAVLIGVQVLCFAKESVKEDASAAAYEAIAFSAENGGYVHEEKAATSGTLARCADFINYGGTAKGIVLKESVRLTEGITLNAANETTSFIVIDGNVELDLCGSFITQMSGNSLSAQPLFVVPKGCSLRIFDSSENGDGIINGVQCAVWVRGGRLTLDSGTVAARSQASTAPDEYELPIKVTDGGMLEICGGKIEYSGNLDDGRTYSARSCAIYADNTGQVSVSSGEICGDIECDEKSSLEITGGSFVRDMSEYTGAVYEFVKDGELYTVKRTVPEVSGYSGNAKIPTETQAEYNADGSGISTYTVSALSETGFRNETRFEISQLFSNDRLTADKISEVILRTDIADFILGCETIMDAAEASADGTLFFKAERFAPTSDENRRLLSSAKREIRFGFFGSDNAEKKIGGRIDISIPYLSGTVEQSVRVYEINGSGVRLKSSSYSDGVLKTESDGGGSLLIAEGSAVLIQGRSLDLQGTIALVFYAALENVNTDSAEMMFWDSPQQDYTEETAERIVKCSGRDLNGYKFEYKNISSKDMNKTVYARLKVKDSSGNVIYGSVPAEGYSVIKYARNMLGNEKLRPLIVRMLNYGAAAQEYFGSDDPPANEILSEGERAVDYTKIYTSRAQTITEDTEGEKSAASIKGKTLLLDGDISIRYYTEMNESADEMGILFWNENAFRNAKEHVLGTQSDFTNKFEENGGYKVFTYGNIVSSAMNKQIYARIYTRHGSEYRYGDIDCYSVRDYAANSIARGGDEKLVRLLRNLLLYGDEAERYFESLIVTE